MVDDYKRKKWALYIFGPPAVSRLPFFFIYRRVSLHHLSFSIRSLFCFSRYFISIQSLQFSSFTLTAVSLSLSLPTGLWWPIDKRAAKVEISPQKKVKKTSRSFSHFLPLMAAVSHQAQQQPVRHQPIRNRAL